MQFIGVGVVLILVVSASAENPGAELLANQAALNYAKSIGVQIINKKLANTAIADVSKREKFYSYDLTSINLQRFNAPNSGANIILQPPTNLQLAVSQMTAYITANYKIKVGKGWFSIRESGSITASGSSISITQTVSVTQSGGKPQLSTGSCNANVGNLDIKFHGKVIGSILNVFKSAISDYVRRKINEILCDEVKDLVNSKANPLLKNISTSMEIGDRGFNIDYSLTNNPSVSSTAAVVGMLGKVWYTGHRSDAAIPAAQAMPAMRNSENKMFCVQLEAESVLGSAGYAAQVSGIMHLTVDGTSLSAAGLSTSYLNCSCPETGLCIGGLIPQIANSSCTNGIVSIELVSTMAPTAQVNSTGAFLAFAGTMDFKGTHHPTYCLGMMRFQGNNPGQSPTELLTVGVTLSAVISADLHFTGWKISGSVHVTGASLTVQSSAIGNVDEAGLEQLWQIVLPTVVEEKLNSITNAGFALPTIPNFTVVNPVLSFGDRSLLVCFDGKYTGPLLKQYDINA